MTSAALLCCGCGSKDDADGKGNVSQAARATPPRELALELGDGVTLELVLVPAGEFWMGSPPREEGCGDDELPQHRVQISKPFYLGKTEVTRAQWWAVVGYDPSSGAGAGRWPVDSVSWDDCQEFCRELSHRAGRLVRLPTEAEWEYACRAGTRTPFSFGSTVTTEQASFDGNFPYAGGPKGEYRQGPVVVGSFPANAFGLHDMHGNVWEWCQDRYAGYSPGLQIDPRGPQWSTLRVLRGGSWYGPAASLRSACRNARAPELPFTRGGLRIVVELGGTAGGVAGPADHMSEVDPGKARGPSESLILELGAGVTMTLVAIPPGEFVMGSPAGEPGRSADEEQHRVLMSRPFYLGRTEVTQTQWRAVMGADSDPSYFHGDNLPVECVSWEDCQQFCRVLSERVGREVRLPTEAEWEYACRAGSDTAFSFGATITTERANYDGSYPYGDTRKGLYLRSTVPVCSFPANSFGLYDMHGNVSEWCQDALADYSPEPRVNPPPNDQGTGRVARGGSWYSYAPWCRCANRCWCEPDCRNEVTGFRVVVPAGPAQVPTELATLDFGGDVVMDLVSIPAGEFTMGSPESEPGHSAAEGPRHSVRIETPFYIGKLEVTQAQWRAVMGHWPPGAGLPQQPAAQVSWHDCQEFCRELSRRVGCEIRLPTEAEWEYACRAGSTTPFNFGDTISIEQANYRGDFAYADGPRGESREETLPAASFRPNAFGLYDMHGNVLEWCEDTWHDDYAGAPADGGAWTEGGDDTLRVLRGGAWDFDPSYCRSAARVAYPPGIANPSYGFRVVAGPDLTSGRRAVPGGPGEPQAGSDLGDVAAAPTDGGRVSGAVPGLDLDGGVRLELVKLPAGEFWMGSPWSGDREDPQHRVRISRSFCMGKTEVTQAQWAAVMGNSPSQFAGDDLPVESVSWDECQEFCRRLSERVGREVRLPTEAEWEYACRAGTMAAYGFGEKAYRLGAYAWYNGNSAGKPHAVGRKRPNPWGLHDMQGNVWEWCQDRWSRYLPSEAVDPSGPEAGEYRVRRGGSYLDVHWSARPASRSWGRPDDRGAATGFRVAVSVEEGEVP